MQQVHAYYSSAVKAAELRAGQYQRFTCCNYVLWDREGACEERQRVCLQECGSSWCGWMGSGSSSGLENRLRHPTLALQGCPHW